MSADAGPVRILALNGSLRAGSSNLAVLEAASTLAPADVTVELYDGLGALPHFNPDLDTGDDTALPAPVLDLRRRVADVHAIVVCSPEYAHGIPGSFKNLLDWLVGSVDLPGKPVAIFSASALSTHVGPQLREVLTTMSVRLVEAASITIPFPSRRLTATELVGDPASSDVIGRAVAALARSARNPGSADSGPAMPAR